MKRIFVFPLLISLFCVCTVFAQDSDEAVKMAERQKMIHDQYNELYRRFLEPAGFADEFNSFRNRNPEYYATSYSRSQTAVFIRNLLKDTKGLLDVFNECGLSRGGEYVCYNLSCPIHRNMDSAPAVGRLRSMDHMEAAFALTAVIAGIIVFVMTAGVGRIIVAAIEKRLSQKGNSSE